MATNLTATQDPKLKNNLYYGGTVNLGGATGLASKPITPELKAFNEQMVAGNKNVINSQNLQDVKTIPLAPVPDKTSDYTSYINQVSNDLNNQVTQAQMQEQALREQAKNEYSGIAELQKTLSGKDEALTKEYETQGVRNLYNQLADLNVQAQGLQRESQAIPIQIQEEFKGRGATEAGVAPIQASRLRENALKALSLGQQSAVLSAQYDKAKNYADMLVEAKYKKIQGEIDAKLTNLSSLKEFDLTPAQEKLRQAQERQLSAEKEQNNLKKELETNLNSLRIEIAKKGGDVSSLDNVKSMSEAISKSTQYLNTPETEVIKLGDKQAYLVDKRTGKIIKSFGVGSEGGGVTGGGGYSFVTNADNSVTVKGNTTATQTYASVLNTVLGSSKLTKDQKADLINSIKNGEDPMTVFKNKAKDILGQTESTKITNYEVARDTMKDIQSQMKEFYNSGGNTGYFKGNYEKVINKLGWISDPKLVELGTQIQASLQVYRNAVSGTAYSVQEGVDIASIFPGINKQEGLNDSIIKGRLKAFDATIDASYRTALGEKGYSALKQIENTNTVQKKPDETPAEFVERTLVSKGLKYETTVNALIDAAKKEGVVNPIPVLDNSTGKTGFINYSEYNPNKYTKL